MPRVTAQNRVSTNIPNEIAKARIKKGTTQEEMAKFLNVARSTVAAYEAGIFLPSRDILNLILDYFDCVGDDLYSEPLLEIIGYK